MKTSELRSWLGKYYLFTTAGLGGYLLLLPESIFLPISKSVADDALNVVIPVFLAQLTLVFRWYGSVTQEDDTIVDIPTWTVKGPPLVVLGLLGVTMLLTVIGNLLDGGWTPSPQAFKRIVTFCVSIINATTVYLVASYFGMKRIYEKGE